MRAQLANGLPADFDLPESVGKYYSRPDVHAVGAAYTMPGTYLERGRGSERHERGTEWEERDHTSVCLSVFMYRRVCVCGCV
jgi:hypothetical protein